MVMTLAKKLRMATACIQRINRSLRRKLLICLFILIEEVASYSLNNCRISAAIARYLALYANIVSDMAGNNNAGILMDNVMKVKYDFFRKGI